MAFDAQVAHEPEFGEGIFAEQGRDPLKYTRYIVLEYESPDASDADDANRARFKGQVRREIGKVQGMQRVVSKAFRRRNLQFMRRVLGPLA